LDWGNHGGIAPTKFWVLCIETIYN